MVVATGGLEPAPARLETFRVHEPFDPGPAFAAGRHLAAITCADCHGADLSGGQPTPDEAAPALVIAGAYSLDQFRTLLRTGRPADGHRLAMMGDVARGDLSHPTDAEIASLHAYLQARAERVTQ
jgi:mono/diheme cytochrome c family protein